MKNSNHQDFVNYVLEFMSQMGGVKAKKMFGGHGIFLDGLMFALIADNQLYFKIDQQSVNDFIKKQLPAFYYLKKNKPVKMSFYQAPGETLEDPEQMFIWANKAYEAALRAKRK